MAMITGVHALPLLRASSCHSHEELRGGEIWLVDCHGFLELQIFPLQNGKYKYNSNSHRFNSRDRKVDMVHANTVCGPHATWSMAKCIEVPNFYVWCANDTTLAAIRDTEFPRYAGERIDLVERMQECVPKNTTVQVQSPLRPTNLIELEKYEKSRENLDIIILSSIITIMLLCCFCSSERKYSRL